MWPKCCHQTSTADYIAFLSSCCFIPPRLHVHPPSHKRLSEKADTNGYLSRLTQKAVIISCHNRLSLNADTKADTSGCLSRLTQKADTTSCRKRLTRQAVVKGCHKRLSQVAVTSGCLKADITGCHEKLSQKADTTSCHKWLSLKTDAKGCHKMAVTFWLNSNAVKQWLEQANPPSSKGCVQRLEVYQGQPKSCCNTLLPPQAAVCRRLCLAFTTIADAYEDLVEGWTRFCALHPRSEQLVATR